MTGQLSWPAVMTGTARSLDCQAHIPLKVLPRHVGPVLAVAVEIVQGRAVAVTGDPSGHIQKWDLLTGLPNSEPLKVCRGPVAALALRATSAGLLCLVGGKGVSGTALWDLDEGRRQCDFGRNGATSVALSVDHAAVARRQGQRQPSAIEFLVGVDGLTLVIIGYHDGGGPGNGVRFRCTPGCRGGGRRRSGHIDRHSPTGRHTNGCDPLGPHHAAVAAAAAIASLSRARRTAGCLESAVAKHESLSMASSSS